MYEIEEISRRLGFMPLVIDHSSNNVSTSVNTGDKDCVLYKGDNEHVLDCLQTDHRGLVDFCYIDPPYNTRNSFIYDDRRVSNEPGAFGEHSAWMQFMLTRLVHAKRLLKETGIIAISIDDYEQPYLRVLLDNIFGGKCFLANIAVCRSKNGKGSNGNNVAVNHEYVLIYGKTDKAKILGMNDHDDNSYNKEDSYGKYKTDGLFRKKGDHSLREDRPNLFYPLYFDSHGNVFTEKKFENLNKIYPIDSKGVERRWLWSKDKAATDSWKLYASNGGTVYVKNYLNTEKRRKIRTLWSDNQYLTERATNEIKNIFGAKIFDTPKPLGLIQDLIFSCSENDALILDFFAGTGTTAHAAFNLNRLDDGSRKVILVEDSQKISEKHLAFKHGYRVISDITEKRLSWLSDQDPAYIYNSEAVPDNTLESDIPPYLIRSSANVDNTTEDTTLNIK